MKILQNCSVWTSVADFEVVDDGTIYTPANIPTGPSPTITSFTANPTTVAAGQLVTLTWTTSGQLYNIISPVIGPVRGTSVAFIPTATATYTLCSTNAYGRTTATVTVTVQ